MESYQNSLIGNFYALPGETYCIHGGASQLTPQRSASVLAFM